MALVVRLRAARWISVAAALAAVGGCAAAPASPSTSVSSPPSQTPVHVWAITQVTRAGHRPVTVTKLGGQVQQWAEMMVGDDGVNAYDATIVAHDTGWFTIDPASATLVGAAATPPADQAALTDAIQHTFGQHRTTITVTAHGRTTVMTAGAYTFTLVPGHLRKL